MTSPSSSPGAVDLSECPRRSSRRTCTCEPCKCGYGKHTAVHGPKLDQPPGSEPWGHEYQPGKAAAS